MGVLESVRASVSIWRRYERTYAHALVRTSQGMSVHAHLLSYIGCLCELVHAIARPCPCASLCTHEKPLGSSYHPIIRGFCLSLSVLAMPFSFNLVPTPLSQASGEKRAGEAGATQQSKKPKLPDFSDLVAMESAPKKAGASRLPAVAPLNICCYKITDKAGDSWSQYENVPDAKLWQIQLEHSARPSALFNLRGSFNEFLAEAAKETDGFPNSLDAVAKAGIRLVVADSNDPDGVGFVQWRVSFYVAGADGAVMNFMNLFDDYLVWTMHSSVAEEQT